MTDIALKKEGYFYKCEAQFLFVVDVFSGMIYILSMNDLRQYVNMNYNRLQTKICRKDKNKESEGKIIYIEDYEKYYKITKINI